MKNNFETLKIDDLVLLEGKDIKEISSCLTFNSYCEGKYCSGCPFFVSGEDCKTLFNISKEKIEDNSRKEYDFYIAAPFFNPDQVTRVELVKALLDKKGLTYFSPKDDSAVEDINLEENRKKVFELNCQSINKSRKVIAITDGKDMGTIFEAGYAYSKNIPIIYTAFTLGKDGQFNLMLSESGVAACRTVDELKDAIDGKEIYYEGNIE